MISSRAVNFRRSFDRTLATRLIGAEVHHERSPGRSIMNRGGSQAPVKVGVRRVQRIGANVRVTSRARRKQKGFPDRPS